MKRAKTIEDMCIHKIELGIQSLRKGNRGGEELNKDLDYFFNKLESLNYEMCMELQMKYCLVRIEAEKEIKISV